MIFSSHARSSPYTFLFKRYNYRKYPEILTHTLLIGFGRNYEKSTGQFNMEEVIRSGVPHITVDAWIKRHMDRAHEHNITPRRLDGDEDR